jgi:transcriptional regulator with XRE-family HTH domain
MARQNTLTQALPYAVAQAVTKLGANLRTARLRRNLTIEEAAKKIGTGYRAVADAERGRPGSSIAVYFALLWAYDLLPPNIADPALDVEGLARISTGERARAAGKTDLSNDF